MKLKVILLSIFLLLLCGCEDWDDIYSEYSDVLDKGFTCSYTLVGEAEPGNGLKSLTFKGNNNRSE